MEHNVTYKVLEKELNTLRTKAKGVELVIREQETNIKSLDKVREIIAQILYLKKQEMRVLEEIVNTGLDFAYPNKTLKFRIEFLEKNKRIVPEFYLNELILKNPFVGDGGGIISMIGLLLYIAFIKLQNKKIILLDEVEAMVDITASKKLFEFLDIFAKDNGIRILAITHKNLDYGYRMLSDKIRLLEV